MQVRSLSPLGSTVRVRMESVATANLRAREARAEPIAPDRVLPRSSESVSHGDDPARGMLSLLRDLIETRIRSASLERTRPAAGDPAS